MSVPEPIERVTQKVLAWDAMAASAYRAYAASTGNKNFRGESMPKFEDLPRSIKVAWEAAARHVGNLIFVMETGFADLTDTAQLAEIEADWAGWEPPQ